MSIAVRGQQAAGRLPAFDIHQEMLAPGPVQYATYGQGPVLLSLHGAMGGFDQGLVLARVTGADAGMRVVAPSRPGYRGTPLSSGATPEAQADLYAALLDRLQVDRTTVIAVSGGGASALAFALRHPRRCRALILVSTCAVRNPMPIPLGFRVMTGLARWPGFVRFMRDRALRDPEKRLARSFPDAGQQQQLLSDPVAWPLYNDLRREMFTEMAARLPGTANDIQVTRTREFPLEQVQVPTLVIHGTRDPLLDYERHGLQLAQRIPGARLLTLEEGGHAALFSHRQQVADAVQRFLAGF